MFRSLFQKLFILYLSILVLVTLVLSIVVSALADNYVYNSKHDLLDSVAVKTAAAADRFIAGEISQTALTEIINSLAYVSNAKIYVLQANKAAVEGIDLSGKLEGQYIRDALETVFSGERVFLRRQYSQGFDAQVLFAAYPWYDGDAIRGALLIFSPEEDISAIVSGVRLATWLTATAFVLLGGVLIFFVTRRVVRPIKALDEASRRMALGEAAEDVEVRGGDEAGRLARSFNSMKHKLEQNEALRQELIAGISHDLRTPVTSINGYLSGMAEGVIKPEDYPRYFSVIRQETQRLMRLTDEVLQTAKVRAGSMELSRSRFALREAVDAALAAHAPLAADKGIRIEARVDDSLMVNAEAQKLEQVLSNLIGNAVKYCGRSALVTVGAERLEGGVRVCVADDGPGIDPERLPHIFDRFYRAGLNQPEGYGMGLCIAKVYIEAHGGSITAESRPDNGTRICFTLPG